LYNMILIIEHKYNHMKLRYRYRIYPTGAQIKQMTSVGGAVRFLYNHFLKVNIDQYQTDKTFVWQFDMNSQLPALKKQLPWLKDTYSQVLQQSIKDLDTALKNIKKSGAGFPRFKSKYTTPISFRYQQHTRINADGRVLHLPKIGDIRIKMHRDLPSAYSCVTVTQTPRGWYASFVVDVQQQEPVTDVVNPVGVDMNSKFTALSTGELIQNPRPLAKKFKHIKNQQRKLSRKEKKSRNREKQRLKLARIHDQVRCQRLNHAHQVSARITKSHDLVSAETLQIDEMRKKSKPVAKAIADAGWAQFLAACAYKCDMQGHHFIKINQWLPSSKTCSACGHKKHQIDLSQREYHCDSCCHTQHRDLNSAINIRNWGHQQWCIDHARQELPEAPVDVMADVLTNWGDSSASTMKQEAVGL
jgi:putative transposase